MKKLERKMTNMNVILEAKDIVKTYGYEDNKNLCN